MKTIPLKDRLEDEIASVLAGAANDIADRIVEIIEDLARARIAELLAGLTRQAPPPTRKPSGARRAAKPERVVREAGKAVSGTTRKGTPRVRAPRNCRKCGRPGARADGCGTSHEPLNKSKAANDDEDERPTRTKTIAELIEKSSIGAGLKNARENGWNAELEDLDRELHPRARPSKPKPLDTTTVAIGVKPTCPHGNGSPASCSQCVLAGAKVKTVSIVGGQVVVDGAAVGSTKDHELAARPHQATRGAQIQRARKARKAA